MIVRSLRNGENVEIRIPARVRLSIDDLPRGMRLTALVLTFGADGRHLSGRGSASDVNPNTLKTELDLERPEAGTKQTLLLVATREGVEVPMDQTPQITLAVEDGSAVYSWQLQHGANRATIVLETYVRNDVCKLRSVDQGWSDGWTSLVDRTGCDLELWSILEATREDMEKDGGKARTQAPSGPVGEATIVGMTLEAERLSRHIRAMEDRAESVRLEYAAQKATYDQIVERIKKLHGAEEVLEYAELGIYQPHFDFTDSESYKRAIESVRARQKAMVADRAAVTCLQKWIVGDDRKAGEKLVDRQVKLTLRAFNGEADTAIANVRWHNVVAMEKRISSSATAIDKANESMAVVISPAYLKLKLEELRLSFESRDQLKKERDAATESRREQREQERLERELDAAEREERRFSMMLERARAEAERTNPTQAMKDRIARLETDLDEARRERERTKALAEQTKCGYVYVISNVGSFGEGIVKIGMTRRADPQDRVRELSSASVPFAFDTHAMAYSVVASELESKLHKRFADRRVNVANNRKEFFRCTVDEVEAAVREIMPDAPFTRDREAREWRETMAMRSQRLGQTGAFPKSL